MTWKALGWGLVGMLVGWLLLVGLQDWWWLHQVRVEQQGRAMQAEVERLQKENVELKKGHP